MSVLHRAVFKESGSWPDGLAMEEIPGMMGGVQVLHFFMSNFCRASSSDSRKALINLTLCNGNFIHFCCGGSFDVMGAS